MAKKRRQYKTGSIREVNGRFYLRYYDSDGKQQFEKAGTDRTAAETLLRQRTGELAAGVMPVKAGSKVTVADCLALGLVDHERRGKETKIQKMRMDGILVPAIGWIKAASLTWEQCWAYIKGRQADGIKNSTINRDLSQLRCALKLAASPQYGLIPKAPKVPTLDEGDNVRTGFLTPAEYRRMMDELPDYLRPLLCVGYYTGLRRGTLLSLRLDQVDLDGGLLWVSRSQVKNRKSQTSPILDGEMRFFCEAAVERNKKFLFERKGRPIKNFKTAWENARVRADLPELLFHDLRRAAVRDWLSTDGIGPSTAMAISGHKTASILERYNILDAVTSQRAAKLRTSEIVPVDDKLRTNQGQGRKKTVS